MRINFSLPILSLVFGAIFLAAPSWGQGIRLNSTFENNFSGVAIAGVVNLRSDMPLGSGQIAQIAFAPGDTDHVYVATFENGIWRYDYDPSSVNFFSNGVKVVQDSVVESPPSPDPRLGTGSPNGSLGIAFHDDPVLGTVMYLAPAVAFGGGQPSSLANVQRQRIVRLTDDGGNGVFGDEAVDVNQIIVDNVWVNTHHEINQLQVIGNSLYAAVGTRTSFGGLVDAGTPDEENEIPGETAYSGSVNFIEDLTAITDTSTTNISGFTIPDFDLDGDIDDFDAKVDPQPFGSNDVSKLRVFSTGMRNIYGIAFDDNGQLFVSMNEENADGPDKLYASNFKDDHLFPKLNELVGDWKFDGDHDTDELAFDPSSVALANGYFANFVTPFVESDQRRSSFGGIEFISQLADDQDLRGNILVAQSFDSQVVVMFDFITGAEITMLEAIDGSDSNDRILEVKNDHLGNILVAGQLGRVTLVTVATDTVVEPPEPSGPGIADAAADYVAALSSVDAAPTGLPSGWTYLSSDANTGGTEAELTILPGIGNANNTGFGTDGANFEIPAVVGNNDVSAQFEAFNDGFDGGGNSISGNQGVVGEDLLMVPGFGTDDQFVIARYTISAADLVDSVPGTGSIVGSFRDLVFRAAVNSNSQGSVDVFVFHNGTPVFSVDRDNVPATAGRLTQADGTFNVTGLSFAPGDTISFVVGNNGVIGGDETALQASIAIDLQSDDVLGDFDGNGVVDCDDLDFYIGNIDSAATGSLAQLDLNEDGMVTIDDANFQITTLVQTSNGQTGTFLGDLDCDGSVDVLEDAFALIANLGDPATSYSQGDINFDGTVDVLGDAFLLIANLGSTNNP
ncbi:hypothetical protein N9L06_02340 [Mariniblastus sp.]|nr:hypothetical protein [Mariniblastus sp.]